MVISVRNESGVPQRWDAANRSPGEAIAVASDPRDSDTDGDGASDGAEKTTLHTDPTETVTYNATRTHQSVVIDAIYEKWDSQLLKGGAKRSARALGVVNGSESPAVLRDRELTDRSDDFDFVTPDTDKTGDERTVFTALDGDERTDTWFANRAELDNETDPWDPDTDDDGLTDGQESKWVTKTKKKNFGLSSLRRVRKDDDTASNTVPKNPDSDGDGYWDGWTGVHGVGRSDDVILYMEHLHSGNGLRGDETVPEQAGIHELGSGSSAIGADLFGNGTRYHSNIHMGELHHGTTPTDSSETPSPSLAVEVDFYEGADNSLWNVTNGQVTSEWADSLEQNYALYGVNLDLNEDEVLTDSDLEGGSPFTLPEAVLTNLEHHDTNNEQYLFLADKPSFPEALSGSTQTGINLYSRQGVLLQGLSDLSGLSGPVNRREARGIAIFTDNMQRAANNSAVVNASNRPHALSSTPIGLVAGETTLHEFAHSLAIGDADDDFFRAPERDDEIYSGAIGISSYSHRLHRE